MNDHSRHGPPDDLARLREQHPGWAIEASWVTAGTGSDQRRLLAHCGDVTVSAWDAGGLAAEILRQEAGE
jgi:hypothetical protein